MCESFQFADITFIVGPEQERIHGNCFFFPVPSTIRLKLIRV